MYCIRSPLADQRPPPIHHSTILDSTVTFTVNRDICILGAQVCPNIFLTFAFILVFLEEIDVVDKMLFVDKLVLLSKLVN